MLSQLAPLRNLVIVWIEARRSEERGASLVEYALLLALVVVVAIGALVLVGHSAANLLNNSAGAINNN